MKSDAANLYNPQNQTEQELIDGFVIRQQQFNSIFNVVRDDKMNNPCQHFIIQGLRGTGKTTLLMRLYYEMKRSDSLNNWLIPVVFNEEQYGMNKLFKMWGKIASEIEEQSDYLTGITEQIEKLDDKGNLEEDIYNLLFEELKKADKKIIVFFDNIGDTFKKLNKKELQRFREVLITNNNIRIIGASSVVLESTFDYKQPFFDFFKIVNLKELDQNETIELLKKLDEGIQENTIQEIIDRHPGRIEALRILTGGIPRTIIMLYEIFVNDKNGDSFRDLEVLLDKVTPLYKHRMDNLSTQQQEIMEVIALNWDAIPVKQIARITRMESKAISSQLRILQKNDLIIKKQTSTKNHLYQVKERFFNIWYIMRNGHRSDRNKVKWLTKFLEVWCAPTDIDKMAKAFIEKIKSGNVYDKYAYHLSEAFVQQVHSPKLQEELLSETKKYLENCNSDIVQEISISDSQFIANGILQLIKNGEYDQAISRLKQRSSKTGVPEFHCGYIYYSYLKNLDEAIKQYKISSEKGYPYGMLFLGILYQFEYADFKRAEEYFLKAIENGGEMAKASLLWLYIDTFQKEKAFSFAEKNKQDEADKYQLIGLIFISIWKNDIAYSMELLDSFLNRYEEINLDDMLLSKTINFLISKKQYNFIFNLFSKNDLNLKDRYKPTYYALMHYMKKEFPDEMLKMGSEMEEPVNAVIKEIELMAKKYV